MKLPYVLLEIMRKDPISGRISPKYQVEKETAGLRFKQEGNRVIKQVYNYIGWYADDEIPYAKIIERFRYGKDAQKELHRLKSIAQVMQS